MIDFVAFSYDKKSINKVVVATIAPNAPIMVNRKVALSLEPLIQGPIYFPSHDARERLSLNDGHQLQSLPKVDSITTPRFSIKGLAPFKRPQTILCDANEESAERGMWANKGGPPRFGPLRAQTAFYANTRDRKFLHGPRRKPH